MIIRVSGFMSIMREDIAKAKRILPNADFQLVGGEFGGYYLYFQGENEVITVKGYKTKDDYNKGIFTEIEKGTLLAYTFACFEAVNGLDNGFEIVEIDTHNGVAPIVLMKAEQVKPEIVVTKRSDDYKATVQGMSGVWGAGKNPSEAIGDVVRCNPELFNVEIRFDYEQDKD